MMIRYRSRETSNTLRPTTIANFAVTYRCNSRCKTCNIWRMESPERGEMSVYEVQGLFSSNRDFLRDVRSIQLTGGEPFLREDLPELVSTIHDQIPNCTYWIPTNGTIPKTAENTAKMLETLEGSSLGISVSVDGPERTHDHIRGYEGCFKKAMETLRSLSTLRDEHQSLARAQEHPLREIWRSREAKEARQKIRDRGCPGCWVECEAFRDIHRDRVGLVSTAFRALMHPSTAGIG